MTVGSNAKTQKKQRGNYNGFYSHTSIRMDQSEGASGSNGIQPYGTDNNDCSRENKLESTQRVNSSAGKILERVKRLESEYLSYVEEHQERLETRLKQSKQRESKFREEIRQLELELQELISTNTDQ